MLLLGASISLNGQLDNDSLWGIWSNESQHDTVRLKALSGYFYNKYMRTDADSALLFARIYFDFAKRGGHTKEMGIGMNEIGHCHLSLGQTDSALLAFKESIAYSESAGNLKFLAGAYINRGIVLNHIGKSGAALDEYNKGIEICEEIGDIEFKLNALNNKGVIYLNGGRYDEAIAVFQEVIESAGELSYGSEAHQGGHVNIGYALSNKGDYAQAIEHYNQCLKLIDKYGGGQVEHFVYLFLGNSYRDLGETENALKYYQKAYERGEKMGDPSQMANPIANIASIYEQRGENVKARANYRKAYNLLTDAQHIAGALTPQMRLADMDLKEGALDSAEVKFAQVLEIAIEIDELDKQADCLAGLGRVTVARGELERGAELMEDARKIGVEMGSMRMIRDFSKDLSQVYKTLGKDKLALEMYEQFVLYRDSLQSDNNKRTAIRQEYRYSYEKQAIADSLEFAQKEAIKDLEIEKRDANLAKQRIGLVAAGGGLLLLVLLAYSIRRGKKRSDELLHNILPEEIATELKQRGMVSSKRIEQVTVLFTDFKGFTAMSEKLTPQELVEDLNTCFSAFDRIVEKYGIEKIKTIGDAYMAAGGLPLPDEEQALHVIQAALEMRDFVENGKKQKIEQGLPYFDVRIGIHTGPVVAGIVGVKKFQYDIWGDTVNTASRMESSGEVGKVNISATTYDLVKEKSEFQFTSRGKVEAKGKGEMEMYFVSEK
jgi:class 3 adenylate cyclase/Tfp pilus assembly protein PilF